MTGTLPIWQSFAMGGAGLVFTEACAVLPEGRITHGDTGIWTSQQAEAWARIVNFLQAEGAKAAIQIGHAGPKSQYAKTLAW